MTQGFMRGSKRKTNSPAYPFLWLIQQFQVATRSTSTDMTTVFHAWLYGRFIEIQSNLRRKKLHRTNQGSNFLGGSFSNRDNVTAPIQLRRESQPQPSIFTSIAPVILDQSNETSLVFPALKSTSYFLPQFKVSRRSDSSLEANSSCCHRSEMPDHILSTE